jgi:elongation factor 2
MVLDGNKLLHVCDVPGHVEYSAELTVMVPICDGALCVVDASKDSVPVAMSQQMKQIGKWNLDPVLFCNRLDTPFLVTKKSPQEIVDDMQQVVDAFNNIVTISSQCKPLNPEQGNVIFGSAANGWAFDIPTLATFYAKKLGLEVDKMCTRLWGEQYFNAATKKWSNVPSDGSVRGMVKLILDPINGLLTACEANDAAKVEKFMGNMGVTMTPADKKLQSLALFKRMMQLWMPAGPCIAGALMKHVADPKSAQAKRFEQYTSAPTTDACSTALKNCDTSGPLMFHIVKLAPQPSTAGRFFALGRVFSGALGADKGYLLEDDYVPPHARVEEETAPAAAEGEEEAAAE